jgi:membrane-associated phospholipid phosphatase
MRVVVTNSMKSEHITEVEQTIPPSRLKRFLELAGSFYGIALLISAIAAVSFAWLASEVLDQEFAAVNRDVLLWIHTFSSPVWDTIALTLTWLGSGVGVTVLMLMVMAGFLYYRRTLDAVTLAVLVIGGGILSTLLKAVFQQIRPELFPTLVKEVNFSFPSGHSLISFTFWGFVAVWLIIEEPRQLWRWIVGVCCLAMAALVALTRLYLGVHWPTDVVAGMLIATFWVWSVIAGRQMLIDWRKKRQVNEE